MSEAPTRAVPRIGMFASRGGFVRPVGAPPAVGDAERARLPVAPSTENAARPTSVPGIVVIQSRPAVRPMFRVPIAGTSGAVNRQPPPASPVPASPLTTDVVVASTIPFAARFDPNILSPVKGIEEPEFRVPFSRVVVPRPYVAPRPAPDVPGRSEPISRTAPSAPPVGPDSFRTFPPDVAASSLPIPDATTRTVGAVARSAAQLVRPPPPLGPTLIEVPILPGHDMVDAGDFERVNASQVRYRPMSRINPTGAVIPLPMALATRKALEKLSARVGGDIDRWVMRRTGWNRAQLKERLSSEQIDAVALGIDAADRGEGLIIADMTGFGKGRALATIAVAMSRSTKKTIWLTVKKNLFSDAIRDVRDIGSDDVFGRPLLLNDGSKIIDTGSANGEVLVPAWKKPELARAMKKGGMPKGTRLMMSTYSQFNRKGTAKVAFLETAAKGSHVILDESHMFVGDSNTSKSITTALEQASGATFSSATFGRDVSNLGAYKSVFPWLKSIPGLDEMLPWQRRAIAEESVRHATEAGRIIRREHDLTNMLISILEDTARLPRNEAMQDMLAPIFSGMGMLAKRVGAILEDRNEDNMALIASLPQGERKVNRETWFTANFGSRHSLLKQQFQIALLVDMCVDEAVESLLKGEKPIVVIDATMESLMRELASSVPARTADAELSDDEAEPQLSGIEDPDSDTDAVADVSDGAADRPPTYMEALAVVADRILKVNCTKGGEKFEIRIRDPKDVERDQAAFDAAPDPAKDDIEDLDAHRKRRIVLELEASMADGSLVERQKAIQSLVKVFPTLSLSPLDDIREKIVARSHELVAQGRIKEPWVVGEVSGRSLRVLDGRYETMPNVDRNQIVAGFQNGGVDVLVLTAAGSTGLSAHDNKGLGRRHMIFVKRSQNPIDDIQMMGRGWRRGQVTEPRFTMLSTGLPFHVYDMAVQNRKAEEMSASVTGAKDTMVRMDVPDPINSVGNDVAFDLLMENQILADRMGISLNVDREEADKEFYFVQKLMKRLSFLKTDLQRRVFTAFIGLYDERIRNGAVPHDGRAVDGAWEPVKREILEAGDGSDNPVTGGDVFVTTIRSFRTVNPMSSDDVTAIAAAASVKLGPVPFAAHVAEINGRTPRLLEEALLSKRFSSVRQALASSEDNAVKRASFRLGRMSELMSRMAPGASIAVSNEEGDVVEGVVLDVKAPSVDRAATPRDYMISYALPGEEHAKSMSLDALVRDLKSQVGTPERARHLGSRFDGAPRGEVPTERKVIDGNGIGAVLASRRMGVGTRIAYTGVDGYQRAAILVPRSMERKLAAQESRTSMPEVAVDVLTKGADIWTDAVNPPEGIHIKIAHRGAAVVSVPHHKITRKIWESPDIVALTGPFEGDWKGRSARVHPDRLPTLLKVLAARGLEFNFDSSHREFAIGRTRVAAAIRAAVPHEPEPVMGMD